VSLPETVEKYFRIVISAKKRPYLATILANVPVACGSGRDGVVNGPFSKLGKTFSMTGLPLCRVHRALFRC